VSSSLSHRGTIRLNGFPPFVGYPPCSSPPNFLSPLSFKSPFLSFSPFFPPSSFHEVRDPSQPHLCLFLLFPLTSLPAFFLIKEGVFLPNSLSFPWRFFHLFPPSPSQSTPPFFFFCTDLQNSPASYSWPFFPIETAIPSADRHVYFFLLRSPSSEGSFLPLLFYFLYPERHARSSYPPPLSFSP